MAGWRADETVTGCNVGPRKRADKLTRIDTLRRGGDAEERTTGRSTVYQEVESGNNERSGLEKTNLTRPYERTCEASKGLYDVLVSHVE